MHRRRFGRGVDPLGLSPSHTSLLQMANRVMMISGWCEEFDISSKPDTDQLANSQNWSFVFELTRLFCFCPAFNQVHLTPPLLEHTILVLSHYVGDALLELNLFICETFQNVGLVAVMVCKIDLQGNAIVLLIVSTFFPGEGGAALQEID